MTYINKTLTIENRLVKPYLMCISRNWILNTTQANYQVFNNIPNASFNLPANTVAYNGTQDYTIATLPAGYYYYVEIFHALNVSITNLKIGSNSVTMKQDEQGLSCCTFELLSDQVLSCNRSDSPGVHEWINIFAIRI